MYWDGMEDDYANEVGVHALIMKDAKLWVNHLDFPGSHN